MFDSPIEWCASCADWVALDQSVAECAARQGCTARRCPLARLLLPRDAEARTGVRLACDDAGELID